MLKVHTPSLQRTLHPARRYSKGESGPGGGGGGGDGSQNQGSQAGRVGRVVEERREGGGGGREERQEGWRGRTVRARPGCAGGWGAGDDDQFNDSSDYEKFSRNSTKKSAKISS